jgi:hypothetical protein
MQAEPSLLWLAAIIASIRVFHWDARLASQKAVFSFSETLSKLWVRAVQTKMRCVSFNRPQTLTVYVVQAELQCTPPSHVFTASNRLSHLNQQSSRPLS